MASPTQASGKGSRAAYLDIVSRIARAGGREDGLLLAQRTTFLSGLNIDRQREGATNNVSREIAPCFSKFHMVDCYGLTPASSHDLGGPAPAYLNATYAIKHKRSGTKRL